MARPGAPLFLARDSYRRRRLGDAARLLPVLGFVLMLLPGFLTVTVDALIYVFTIWAILILGVGLMSRKLGDTARDTAGLNQPDED